MGILEYILNTPSHHRVHHGSNPKYIDKNHAGTLIIWDKLFGTFQKEEEEVYYGITTPLASWNPVWANFHYWAELWHTAKQTNRLIDRINVFVKPPGWYPESIGGFKNAPEIDTENYKKFDDQYHHNIILYVLFQFLIALACGSALLFLNAKMSTLHLTYAAIFTILTLLSCGALLKKKNWLRLFEFTRLIISIIVIYLLKEIINSNLFVISAIGLLLISIILFYFLQKSILYAQKTSRI